MKEQRTLSVPLGEQSTLISGWLPPSQADSLLASLPHELPWRQERIHLFGRKVSVPRLQCWVGDPGIRYRYSGLTLEPEPWPAPLAQNRQQLEQETGKHFNSVLCNWYRDGRDSMGWHSDDEPELGPEPMIASLTLGQTRRFQFRRKGQSQLHTTVELPHNSLLLMPPGLQELWQHQLL